MSIKNVVKDAMKKIFVKLGENNKPTYAVMAIAVVKGIARPIFTMTDKHADPESKKYAALREGLTEVVAIPTYWASGELASKVADKLNFDHLPKDKQIYARESARQNFMFIGVCTAALLVIPALASLTIKPFMKKLQEKKSNNKEVLEKQNINVESPVEKQATFKARPINKNLNNALYSSPKIGGMKVGGIW